MVAELRHPWFCHRSNKTGQTFAILLPRARRCGRHYCNMLTRRLLSTTLTKACARPSVRVQIRSNTGVTVKDYFNPYFPPNGKLEELPDQTPHDFTKRPKRINTRLGTRLDRILRFTDYHSLKKQPEAKRVRPKPPPREVPEARST
jgi:hypothetical protein